MRALPPYPGGGTWSDWALRLVEYLQDRDRVTKENLPQQVFLEHQTNVSDFRAVEDGIVMYDPARDQPV